MSFSCSLLDPECSWQNPAHGRHVINTVSENEWPCSVFHLQISLSQLLLTGTSQPALLIIRDIWSHNEPPGASKPCAQYKSGFQHRGHLRPGSRSHWSLRPWVWLRGAFSLSHLTFLGGHSWQWPHWPRELRGDGRVLQRPTVCSEPSTLSVLRSQNATSARRPAAFPPTLQPRRVLPEKPPQAPRPHLNIQHSCPRHTEACLQQSRKIDRGSEENHSLWQQASLCRGWRIRPPRQRGSSTQVHACPLSLCTRVHPNPHGEGETRSRARDAPVTAMACSWPSMWNRPLCQDRSSHQLPGGRLEATWHHHSAFPMHPAAGELCWALQTLSAALQQGD